MYLYTVSDRQVTSVATVGNTHTHPFDGPFSGSTRVSRYQKGKTNLDFTEARDSEWQWHQLGHMQVCTSLQTDNHASTRPLISFYRLDALPATQPTALKHWRPKHYSMNNCSVWYKWVVQYQTDYSTTYHLTWHSWDNQNGFFTHLWCKPLLQEITIWYDKRCYFNVRSKADISQLNLPHGTDN